MSSEPQRQNDVIIATVRALRSDDALVSELYGADGSSVPTDSLDRQRVYRGQPADKRDDPAKLAVLGIATGSTVSKNALYVKTWLVQCTVVYSESCYERRGLQSMVNVRDRCDAVLSEGNPEQYPTGPEGGSSPETDDDGYRLLTNRFRLVTVE